MAPTSTTRSTARTATRTKPRVRLARVEDRAAIAALFADSERLHARWHPSYFRGEGKLDPRIAGALEGDRDDRALYVVDRAGKVLGFVHVELLEPRQRHHASFGRRAHIDVLVVEPATRRSGCGRALLEAATRWARERAAVELLLTVWAGNTGAERFYERLGLQSVSRVMKLPL